METDALYRPWFWRLRLLIDRTKETDGGEVPFSLRNVLQSKQSIRAKGQHERGVRARAYGDGLVKRGEPGNVLELIGAQKQLCWREFAFHRIQRHG